MSIMKRIVNLAIAAVLAGASAGLAQTPAPAEGVVACPEQQDLEQYLGTGGELMPDGCRRISVVQVESDGRTLCAIDFGDGDDGVIGQIREVATTTTWWVDCAALGAELQ
jgi:hypothetical protein